MRATRLLFTCEHGGNRVPSGYRNDFAHQDALLASHRGWDPGALQLARGFARRFRAPLISSTVTRLLVELNRSPGHPEQFSAISSVFHEAEKHLIVQRYYETYRRCVEEQVLSAIDAGDRMLHLSVHSFTPELDGAVRTADIGLLFDPARPMEASFCRLWGEALEKWPYVVQNNYPYKGTDDGLTTWLRTLTPPASYAGIELEVNQRFVLHEPPGAWHRLGRVLRRTFAQSLKRLTPD